MRWKGIVGIVVFMVFLLISTVCYAQLKAPQLQFEPPAVQRIERPETVEPGQTFVMALEQDVESFIFHVTLGSQNRIRYLADDLSLQPEECCAGGDSPSLDPEDRCVFIDPSDCCIHIEGIPGESAYAVRFTDDGPGVFSHPDYDEWWKEDHQVGRDLLRDARSFWVRFVPGRQGAIRIEPCEVFLKEVAGISAADEEKEALLKEGALVGVTAEGRFMPTLSLSIESTPGEQFTVRFDDQGGLLLKLRPEKSAFTMDLGGDAMGLAVDNIMETEAETFSATSFISLGRNPQTGKDIAAELISEISSKKASGLSIIVVDGAVSLEHIGKAISNVNEFLPLSPPKK